MADNRIDQADVGEIGSFDRGGATTEASQFSKTGQSDNESNTSRKHCWVCFATEEDDRTLAWVRPCRCRGSTKWVHQQCLQRWIDEKLKTNSNNPVRCPQCNTEYVIIYPARGTAVYLLNLIDKMIYKVCPFVAAGLVVGSVYWTAVTYGAVTVMQVLGHKEGLNVMEQADPLFLLIGLPTIPITLILGKMVRWEDYVLKIWRKHSRKLPLLGYFFSSESCQAVAPQADVQTFSDPLSATRVLCGAMILPTIATIFGKIMFNTVINNLHRTILGGISFIAIKGALKLYYIEKNHRRRLGRRILDFEEPETQDVASGQQPVEQVHQATQSDADHDTMEEFSVGNSNSDVQSSSSSGQENNAV